MEYKETTTLIVIAVVLAVVVTAILIPQDFWVGLSMNLFK
jgi:hypothetical protein